MLQVSEDAKVPDQMVSVLSYQISKNKAYTHDECSAFISEMIKLLNVAHASSAESIAAQIVAAMDGMFNISAIYQSNWQYMEHDIAERIKPVLQGIHHDISHMKKTVLKLCRRIVTTIQNHQHKFSTEIILALNRIETLIEERIVTERDTQSKQSATHRLYEPKFSQETAPTQNYYMQCSNIKGLKLSIARNINASTKYTKVGKDIRHGEYLDIVTVDPKPIENIAQLELLFEDAWNRLKMEATMDGQKGELDEVKALIKTAKKSNTITPEIAIRIDKILRPVRAEQIHIIYLCHDQLDEHYMANRAKEAFAIGAQLFLLTADESIDAVYSGVELINSLLDKDIHPDKIVMLSRGVAVHTATRIKALFSKQGLNITQISYQTDVQESVYDTCICTHRTLNINDPNLYTKKVSKNVECPEEYKVFATYISKQLRGITSEHFKTNLVDIHLRSCSLIQLISLFLKTSQSFIQCNSSYANPALPLDRVRVLTSVC